VNQLSVFLKQWMEKSLSSLRSFIVLSKAFGKILNQEYQVDHSKIHVIPGGVDISRFQTNLSRHVAREQLAGPRPHDFIYPPLSASDGLR